MAEHDGDAGGRKRAAVRRLLLGCSLLIGGMAALSVWVWATLPAGTEVVLHRDITGEPTRTGQVTVLLLVMPLFAVLMSALLAGVLSAGGTSYWEPDLAEPAEPADPMVHAWFGIGVIGLFAAMHAIFLLDAVDVIGDPFRLLLGGMGAAAALFGGLLWSQRHGEALMQVSVNLPRPTAREERRRLRRAVGAGFVATGALTALSAATGPTWLPVTALVAGLVASCGAGLVTSLRHQT